MTESELERRLSEATGPDRELDAAIEVAMFGGEVKPRGTVNMDTGEEGSLLIDIWRDGRFVQIGCAPYTASIDSAIALVERKLPGIWWVLAKGRLTSTEPLFGCELLFGSDQQLAIADGPSMPLAICLCLILALATQEPTNA